MRHRWKRLGAAIGIVGLLGLSSACAAEVDPEGDGLEVDVDTSPDEGETGDE